MGQHLSYLSSLLDDVERLRDKQNRLHCKFESSHLVCRVLTLVGLEELFPNDLQTLAQ